MVFPNHMSAVRSNAPRVSIPSQRPIGATQWMAIVLVLGLFWRFACGDGNVPGQSAESEYSAKAASLMMLLDWVKWPTEGPINVGILGDDPFGAALEKLKPKHSNQIEDLKDCQIIFIPKSAAGNVSAILDKLSGENVFTVGESDGFAKLGGMVGFVMEGDQVRFEINTGTARQAGFKIDLRLLKLAKRVFNS
jgi:hypothetical protein